jgi:alanine dehydrogenase
VTATLLLSRQDLSRLLDPASVIQAVEQGFRAYSRGDTVTPVRIQLELPDRHDVLLVMPCAVREPAALGTKLAAVYRGNAARGLPTVPSVYLLSDPDTGLPLAAMDGTYLTAIRTAAASAVATRVLARSDSEVLGIFGTGTLAEFHLRVLPVVRTFHRALVKGRTTEAAQRFVERLRADVPLDLRVAASADEVAAQADVIVTATTALEPLFDGRLVRPGTHVNAVGAFTPTTREVDGRLVARAILVADTHAGVRAEAGDLLLAIAEGAVGPEHPQAELGEILLGVKPGRRSADDITLFESVGAAFEDAVTARLAYERARAQAIGTPFSFW